MYSTSPGRFIRCEEKQLLLGPSRGQRTDKSDQNHLTICNKRLLELAVLNILSGLVLLLFSGLIDLAPSRLGRLVWGHRSEIVLVAAGLFLLGGGLWVSAISHLRRELNVLSSSILGMGTAVISCGVIEADLNRPSRLHLTMPAEIAAIEQRYVEPGVGFRLQPHRTTYHATVPYNNIPHSEIIPTLVDQERHTIEVAVDRAGFCNPSVPKKTDILTLGDSFTMCADVDFRQGWVSHLSRETGLSVYNLGVGGYGPSQELEIYRRYGETGNPWGVIAGIYGINELVDEEQYAQFLDSRMAVKQWAYRRAGAFYPAHTFAILNLWQRWVGEHTLSRFKAFAEPEKSLKPIRTKLSTGQTELTYYPSYQYHAYNVSTLGPENYPPAQRMIKTLRTLARECAERNQKLAILYFPLKQTIHSPASQDQEEWLELIRACVPGPSGGWRTRDSLIEAGSRVLQADMLLESYLGKVCGEMQVPFHSLRPSLKEYVQDHDELVYYRFDTHWNNHGNAAVGHSVADWLATIPEWST